MNVLLDTCTFLWILNDSKNLTTKAKKTFLNDENECFLSVASLWEIAIKVSLGKLKLPCPLQEICEHHLAKNAISVLHIKPKHLFSLESMPYVHKDPFDRLIFAQANAENMALLTSESIGSKYGVRVIWK
jgi:PIN domain nuclease of toxin-antitoxin system